METVTHSERQEATTPRSSLLGFLDALRRRLVWAALAVIAGTMISWGVSGYLFEWLARPLTSTLIAGGQDPRLAYTRLADPFIVYLSVAILGGIMVASPVIMGQVWQLLAPALGRRRLLSATAFVLIATLLFLAGVGFGQQVLLPFVVRYLLDVASGLQQVITARQYLAFSIRLLLILGAAAQLPLLSFTLSRIGLVTARRLWRWFPYATLIAFTLAALITPPDGVSQVLVAVPILTLYLCSVLIAALAAPRKRSSTPSD